MHLKWEYSHGIQSTHWHLDLEEAHTGKKNRYFYNWIMDTTLDMSLECLLREDLLGKNPTEGSVKGSPTFLAEVMLCLKLTWSSRSGSSTAATPHMPHLCMTDCWWCHEEKKQYIWDSSCGWGWVQILPKAVITAYLAVISLLDVGAKGRACWSHLTQN